MLTDQHIGRRELTGACLTWPGIVFFVSAGQPQGGTSHPSAARVVDRLPDHRACWSSSSSASASRFSGAAKALTFGAAAGLGYGLQAAVTKTFVTEIGSGVLALLTSWSVYVLILSAVTGFALQQSALKTGVLAPAMASSNSVTLFTSVVLGIAVYGETSRRAGAAHSGSTVVGLIVAIVGIALLAGSEAPQRHAAGVAGPVAGHVSPSASADLAGGSGRSA